MVIEGFRPNCPDFVSTFPLAVMSHLKVVLVLSITFKNRAFRKNKLKQKGFP